MDSQHATAERQARLIWQQAPALTGALYLQLLVRAGSAWAALKAGSTLWRDLELPLRCQAYLQEPPNVTAALHWLDAPTHTVVMFGDAEYSPLLAQLPDAPIGLYVQGKAEVLRQPQLAVVGSRNPTPYGRDAATAFARHLNQCGLVITSGLAAGIDVASHRGALQGRGQTIAVCGTGLDCIYPRSSEAVAREIVQQGALVSEFPLGTPPRKHHFPQRNRVISGLSLGVLVIEAAPQSGSLITARLAGDQGREVFALPGSIHSPLSKGCHELIRQGAKLVDCVDDILVEMGSLAATLSSSLATEGRKDIDLQAVSENRLDKEYEILLDALGFEPASIDQLVARSGLKTEAIASMLLILELDGRIVSYPGGRYVRAGDS
jgi:DNA processing protein